MEKKKNFFKSSLEVILEFFKKIFSAVLKFVKKHKILSIIIAVVLIIVIASNIIFGKNKRNQNQNENEVQVKRMTITDSISGSSVIEANNEYSVTPLVMGEILEADFEEGDEVEKDQVLYVIESSSVETSLKSAQLNIEKAQDTYNKTLAAHTDDIAKKTKESNNLSVQKSQNSYNDALDSLDDLTVTADFSGTVSNVYVSAGDDVANGTKLADIIDNSVMKLKIPFNTADAERIHKGEAASVTLVDNGNVLNGVVEQVSSGTNIINGNMRISYVTIKVNNPGAILEGNSATAMVGDYACNDVGQFEACESRTILSKVTGTVSGVWAIQGDYVLSGSTIVTIDSDAVDNTLRNADLALREARLNQEKSSLEQMDADTYATKLKAARIALDDAMLQRDKINDQLEDYTIKSPISGTVVAKNKKAGEKIESGSGGASSASSSSNSNVLAVIYDMTSLCFQLDVDEIDVKKIEVGQEVSITADAAEGKKYTGVVENVSINGTIGSNGVTTYPVKVRLSEFDDILLPGMNIEAEIVVEESEDVLCIPSDSLNRGNTVYVKGDKTDENDAAPEGFKTVQVETGISNDNFIEVKSGLNENDIVYVKHAEVQNQFMMPGGMGGMGAMHGGMSGGMGGGMSGGGRPGGGGTSGGGGTRQ